MSTVVFVGQKIPEKHLLSELTFKYVPDSSVKETILEDIKKHTGCELNDYAVDFDLKVILKEYKNTNEPTKNP